MESWRPNTTVSLCHGRFLVSLLLNQCPLLWTETFTYYHKWSVINMRTINKQTLHEEGDLECKSRSKKIKQHQLRRVWPWLSLSSRTSHCRGFGHCGRFDRPVTPIEGDQLMWVDVMGCHMTFFSFLRQDSVTRQNRFHWQESAPSVKKTAQNRVNFDFFCLFHFSKSASWSQKRLGNQALWHHNGLLSLTGTTTSPSRYFYEPPRPNCGPTLSKCDKILGFCKKTLYQRTV